MSKAEPQEYYDLVYSTSQKYSSHWSKSPYLGVYKITLKHISNFLNESKNKKLLDIGCGTGQFLHMLHDHGYIDMSGVDFSDQALMMTRSLIPSIAQNINKIDLENIIPYSFHQFEILTCLEVLEHINNDLSLLSSLKKGQIFIGSVPNFDSKGHVRIFNNEHDIKSRYSTSLDIKQIEHLSFSNNNKIFVFSGVVI